MTRRWLGLAILVVACSGCVTDLKRVANAATSHVYNEARYKKECVVVAPPSSCGDFQKAQLALKWEAVACDTALRVGKGKLPSVARKRLKAAMAATEKMP